VGEGRGGKVFAAHLLNVKYVIICTKVDRREAEGPCSIRVLFKCIVQYVLIEEKLFVEYEVRLKF